MPPRRSIDELGPLFTIADDDLSRPVRRREDRDVLVLRVEIEAQRREVERLLHSKCGSVINETSCPQRQSSGRRYSTGQYSL
jgi:hypothetical protein